ncbi:MAG: GNAT family N-acetyltransferase [Candidatus Eremiobacterota bacterium]
MKSIIRPVYYKDLSLFEKIWKDFILSETSSEDRFLHPLRLSCAGFITGKFLKSILGEPSFWDNFLVYEVDGTIKGFMEVCPSPGKSDGLFIKNFVISSSYRNRGLGKDFLYDIIDKFSAHGIREFYLEVRKDNRAVNFYRRAGFFNRGSKYYMIFTSQSNKIITEEQEGFKLWVPYLDTHRLNDFMRKSTALSECLIPCFPEYNYIEHYMDNLILKYKREKLEVYMLEIDNVIKASSVIYYYFKHNKALMDIIFDTAIPFSLIEQFLKLIINRIKSGINVIFSFNDMQKTAGNLLEKLGGKIYRENILMKYVIDRS